MLEAAEKLSLTDKNPNSAKSTGRSFLVNELANRLETQFVGHDDEHTQHLQSPMHQQAPLLFGDCEGELNPAKIQINLTQKSTAELNQFLHRPIQPDSTTAKETELEQAFQVSGKQLSLMSKAQPMPKTKLAPPGARSAALRQSTSPQRYLVNTNPLE